ncbi:glycosyltransferase family 2 protein [Giesbergeria anulus]|uniref:Glycosyltransferase involved in cell wall bisynthesis n=1 Tax=Giesbergeria anulus TaxID=180197 RepID=A0A1H9ENZ6_9BURK|nr:glycosyltransferase family 2 protein [Giesbergeria anulus]SEQ27369.1 Glycosyltransferase involved in cell wall bisynthesis [Giesbergeria anulus]
MSLPLASLPRVAVVIPCYRVTDHVLEVIARIGDEVQGIFAVDDCCPQKSGIFIQSHCQDQRVTVLFNEKNQGVGGAVMTGYQAAITAGFDIIVKIDGDGQMNPKLLPSFIAPIINGEADYTKGNRFFDLEQIHQMPRLRLLGNAGLSFLTKISSGYWNLFDPTNGYTAIHASVASHLPFAKISRRYFFETDMLFRLNTLKAVVVDIPMDAHYADEESNLKIGKVLPEFLAKHCVNFGKRIFYNYYLRDMSLASIELPLGFLLLIFGTWFGISHWIESTSLQSYSSAGTVMLAALPIIIGLQLLLAFLGYDVSSTPSRAIQRTLSRKIKI